MNYTSDELYHYGVLGMKWGVRRAEYKTHRNEKLRNKALNFDKKSEKAYKKSEKIHSENDLGRSNEAAKKAANYNIKSAKLQKKALRQTNDFLRSAIERRSNKYAYKGSVKQIEANRLSKTAGYGLEAMRWSIKSDEFAKKAAKTRLTIANNERYIAKVTQRVNSISDKEVAAGAAVIQSLNK